MITKVAVDPDMSNNCYLLRCRATDEQLLVDAAADAPRLLEVIGDSGRHRGHHAPALGPPPRARRRRVRHGSLTVAGADDADAITEQTGVEVARRVGDGDTVRSATSPRGDPPGRPHPRLHRAAVRRPRRHAAPVHRRQPVPGRGRQHVRRHRGVPRLVDDVRPRSSTGCRTRPGSTPATATTRCSVTSARTWPSGASGLVRRSWTGAGPCAWRRSSSPSSPSPPVARTARVNGRASTSPASRAASTSSWRWARRGNRLRAVVVMHEGRVVYEHYDQSNAATAGTSTPPPPRCSARSWASRCTRAGSPGSTRRSPSCCPTEGFVDVAERVTAPADLRQLLTMTGGFDVPANSGPIPSLTSATRSAASCAAGQHAQAGSSTTPTRGPPAERDPRAGGRDAGARLRALAGCWIRSGSTRAPPTSRSGPHAGPRHGRSAPVAAGPSTGQACTTAGTGCACGPGPRPPRAGVPRRGSVARATSRPRELGAGRPAHPGRDGLRAGTRLRLRVVGRRARRHRRTYFAWGYGGQLLEVLPQEDLVAVVLTQQDPTNLVRGFFAAELTSSSTT